MPTEQRAGLHPQQRGRVWRYLLRHWRYVEARRLLWRMLADRVSGLQGQSGGRCLDGLSTSPDLAPREVMRWLRPGDILLDAGGDELAWLDALLLRRPDPAPAIAYRSDIRRTADFGYHPVETVWLLERAGYQLQLLTRDGPARLDSWCTPASKNQAGCWLLAMPTSRFCGAGEPADSGERRSFWPRG